MNQRTLDIQPYHTLLDAHQDAFRLFEQLLIEENAKYNLTRITSPQQVRTRHFLDSLAAVGILDTLADRLKRPLRILDVGSGAGFPGLVLAMVRPEWSFVSLEATEKKARFQDQVRQALGLNNILIAGGRAEAYAHKPAFRESFDAVTARALAVFWKGASAGDEIRQAETAIRQMGADIEQLAAYTLPEDTGEAVQFALVVCRKHSPSPQKYPRVFGIIKKQPLGTSPDSQS